MAFNIKKQAGSIANIIKEAIETKKASDIKSAAEIAKVKFDALIESLSDDELSKYKGAFKPGTSLYKFHQDEIHKLGPKKVIKESAEIFAHSVEDALTDELSASAISKIIRFGLPGLRSLPTVTEFFSCIADELKK